jgi:phage tail sheath gpL-like
MGIRCLHRVALAAALLLATLPAFASPSNKWRLEFSGAAESDGEIVLVITPVGGTPVEVTTTVKKSDGENRIAARVRDALKAAIKDDYSVERDDGEDVLVKRRMGRPDFEIALVSNTVKSVRIGFDRE